MGLAVGRPRNPYRRAAAVSRARRPSGGSCIAGCLTVLVAGVLGAFVAFSTDESPPRITGEQRAVAEHGLAELKREAERIRHDAAERRRRSFSLTVTEAELNLLLSEDSTVRERLAKRGIREAFVHVTTGRIQASLTRTVAGMPIQAQAVLLPELSGPRSVTTHVKSLTIGRVPAPTAPAQRLADEVGRLLSEKVTDTNVVLSGLSVVEGRVELTGRIE